MCRFLAYAGPPVFLEQLLVRPQASLIAQASSAREAKTRVNADGCGVGWYGEREEPGLYRGILPAWSDANLVSLCRQIRARLFLAHVRAATSGEVATANCHPFAHGRHLFMHNGQIGGYDRLRRRVDALIPDELYPARKGTSDSEAIFLAALGAGLDTDPVDAMTRTLARIVAAVRPEETGEPLRFAAVHSDGAVLHAFRWASDGLPPSLYCRAEGDGLVIASEPCDENGGGWAPIPSGGLLTVRPDGAAKIRMLEIPAETATRPSRAA
ncbi:class II glutamine amidotransferase [Aureimonas endophytica]|uniref:Class II glutamine amidotransferase n=1 Tax=Aureimonas endophytica TaxID=2027858 RepID=A0A917E5P8_9HYPH|nr:class II glutamine amidotransferase [Aureimonas endophytica]GGE07310.1 class II glutamine amidotransferase [Aureimonas endophytica]